MGETQSPESPVTFQKVVPRGEYTEQHKRACGQINKSSDDELHERHVIRFPSIQDGRSLRLTLVHELAHNLHAMSALCSSPLSLDTATMPTTMLVGKILALVHPDVNLSTVASNRMISHVSRFLLCKMGRCKASKLLANFGMALANTGVCQSVCQAHLVMSET